MPRRRRRPLARRRLDHARAAAPGAVAPTASRTRGGGGGGGGVAVNIAGADPSSTRSTSAARYREVNDASRQARQALSRMARGVCGQRGARSRRRTWRRASAPLGVVEQFREMNVDHTALARPRAARPARSPRRSARRWPGWRRDARPAIRSTRKVRCASSRSVTNSTVWPDDASATRKTPAGAGGTVMSRRADEEQQQQQQPRAAADEKASASYCDDDAAQPRRSIADVAPGSEPIHRHRGRRHAREAGAARRGPSLGAAAPGPKRWRPTTGM